jgi:hypothetical protein
MGIFDKTQLVKTIRILQKKDCPKSDNQNQVTRTLNHLMRKK